MPSPREQSLLPERPHQTTSGCVSGKVLGQKWPSIGPTVAKYGAPPWASTPWGLGIASVGINSVGINSVGIASVVTAAW